MITKIPDYIISDRGYPESYSESPQLSVDKTNVKLWRNGTIWSSQSINLGKLLPLRQSLTEFYISKLSIQNELIHKTQIYNKNNNIQQSKKYVKEFKNGIGHMRISQQQCPLDKRRSRTISADNDLDQF